MIGNKGEINLSFFDKILQGLGFEGETENLAQTEKPAQKTDVLQNKFDLASQRQPEMQEETGAYEFAPKSQQEIMRAIDYLREQKSVQIDFSGFAGSSMLRAMDFAQGAAYALGIQPQKIAEKTFVFRCQVLDQNQEMFME